MQNLKKKKVINVQVIVKFYRNDIEILSQYIKQQQQQQQQNLVLSDSSLNIQYRFSKLYCSLVEKKLEISILYFRGNNESNPMQSITLKKDSIK